MKKLIQKKWMLSFIASFFIFLSSASAANYKVSGAGITQLNGTYVETGTWNDKPLYIFNNNGREFAIGFQWVGWMIGEWMGDMDMLRGNYVAMSSDPTPPSTGWEGQESMLTVMLERKSLSYSTSLFTEHLNNVGSIANSIVISYNGYGGDAFTGEIDENFIANNKVTVSNVPAGLTASIIKTAANQLTFSLTGNAISHERTDRIDNITLTFQDVAFNQANAANVSNYVKTDIGIQFIIQLSQVK